MPWGCLRRPSSWAWRAEGGRAPGSSGGAEGAETQGCRPQHCPLVVPVSDAELSFHLGPRGAKHEEHVPLQPVIFPLLF
ncbi:hypothetical protein NDU88_003800 [Pleurodeles waltl]|uniref:Uncharacterized protein n=1 Tax=Pleurodeles waltl TaxID=8319 RepID=A0AAV7T676_PLEWA|nr:hypothetical protein NDU88_003800 [Pleurodeles waltl]